MKCPNCTETRVMADRNGVEIDYCPQFRGVWLDRGELDKIIKRSNAYFAKPQAERNRYNEEANPKNYPHQTNSYNDPHDRHKKRKAFLVIFSTLIKI